jgi:hypothetical protein
MSSDIDFWQTLKGLLSRLKMLAHNYTWTLLNAGIEGITDRVEITDPEMIDRVKYVWRTHPELSKEGPCEICDDMDGQEFSPTELKALQARPGEVHPLCYCDWDVVPV